MDEATLIARIAALREAGVLSRFGPLWKAEGLGGAVTLAAIAVPEARFEAVAALVNAHPEVAHNYARDHRLNMWFVLATEDAAGIAATISAIEAETGLSVLNMPREAEYHVGLRLEA
jgi:DNA-binding Lrp family transcriptional regulator